MESGWLLYVALSAQLALFWKHSGGRSLDALLERNMTLHHQVHRVITKHPAGGNWQQYASMRMGRRSGATSIRTSVSIRIITGTSFRVRVSYGCGGHASAAFTESVLGHLLCPISFPRQRIGGPKAVPPQPH